ncbi:DUF3800 domain-containing protein [Pyrococcus abyssi]|uniref:DUF3800 domain-containing protein n=1 Tax=Pyrococcus abyssi (strain GE5 / Orsay) TaxID=272844 RepID=Q9UZD9_PYRAB|nr:DUF3800 domain-containing protein [Pyrococcus abyssi]CAB50120.1 Hypothetical protein PAB0807 [Pyrococcus abyssi GE5]CCE70645.1 TPA: hypothetical protein PAB0807 [Pyrococcus abyssi GE5]
MELFIDESGDLGGLKSPKRYFIVAGVLCDENKTEKPIKELARRFNLNELKFSKLKYEDKVQATEVISTLNFEISYVVLSKNSIQLKLWLDKSKKNKNLAARVLYSTLIKGLGWSSSVIIDQSHYSRDISRFLAKEYRVKVSSQDSSLRPGLQLADAIANILYLHYQFKDKELYEMIKDEVIFTKFLNEKKPKKKLSNVGWLVPTGDPHPHPHYSYY